MVYTEPTQVNLDAWPCIKTRFMKLMNLQNGSLNGENQDII